MEFTILQKRYLITFLFLILNFGIQIQSADKRAGHANGSAAASSSLDVSIDACTIRNRAVNIGANRLNLNSVDDSTTKQLYAVGRIDEMQRSSDAMRDHINQNEQTIGRLDTMQVQAKADIEHLQSKNEELMSKLSKVLGYLHALKDIFRFLNARMKEHADRILMHDDASKKHSEAYGSLTSALNQYDARFKEHHDRLLLQNASSLAANILLGRLQGSQTELSKRVDEHGSSIVSLNDNLSKLQASWMSITNAGENVRSFLTNCFNNLEMFSVVGYPAMAVGNTVLGRIPIVNKFTKALESTFLKILLSSVLYRGYSVGQCIRAGKLNLLADRNSQTIAATFAALILAAKYGHKIKNVVS